MREEFLITRQGKLYVLFAGLLDEAHNQGLKSIDTELLQVPSEENGRVAICKARVEIDGERVFTGIGDASPDNVGRNIVPHIIRMAECVPLRSEILTKCGWKHYNALSVGELVLGYDVDADYCRWVPLKGVTVYPRSPLVTLRSKSFETTCTPDHSWAVSKVGKRVNANQRLLRKACDLKTSDRLLVSAFSEGGDHHLSERDAAVLGWLATDGCLRLQNGYYRAHIDQSKAPYVMELRELLGGDATEYSKEEGEHTFPAGVTYATLASKRFALKTEYLHGLMEESEIQEWRHLPALIPQLTSGARLAMFQAMLHGDGTRRGNGWVFGKKRKPGVMEAFELLATLEGFALGRRHLSSVGDVPLRTVRGGRSVHANYLEVLHHPPEPVWCPTTELGTWLMRQGDQITITGNTRAKARALRDAINVGTAALEELGDEEADRTTDQSRPYQASRENRSQGQQEGQRPGPQGLATRKQLNYLEALVNDVVEDGARRFEESVGKPMSELTTTEASEWIEKLSNRQAQ